MDIRLATLPDLERYAECGRRAQAWLDSQGIGQYVPAAHAANHDGIRARITAGTLFVAVDQETAVGFFAFDPQPSIWWPTDGLPARYLSGMVVDRQRSHCGVGSHIIRWAAETARQSGCQAVRLDCFAGNPWLCRYYERHGFQLQGQIEQHPGYMGCLYQLHLNDDATAQADD
ncbi:GNAT family N-acetyltransferase [Tuwongella immobilis]|uniref:N-acetyltransferase domain-containing protein n=1 Tax=Tuwongella immobilis TaxID=692036 RepID=A0A6C2YUQ8_9BACT|nr:GNAT family N-acetyltransferase [Tuwongella immobilis]VIP05468.1 protein tyrosine phosphatase : Acetyltransferase, GNAT family OS=Fusobacterium varium ATCC 27725 GN=FVAG_02420 PE=4 SV=1: Acetyltransf_1 [Tuwongella immobilis]VTS08292.1 protein tyrosine phosphatase : Acetyltransferase, GNAT family OS=Fusobacterium varium ATCC 27725 GN=FVAG_02420 PE=4 SV=1: Acetyltransf_1 [Tuwongella immobilis]